MENAIKMFDILAWPITVLLLCWLIRKPIQKLVPLIENIKYKDVEINFAKQLEQVKEEVGEEALIYSSEEKNKSEIYALIDASATGAVIEAWKAIEISAREKVKDLLPPGEKFRAPLRRPVDYLEHTGALIPSTARAIRDMRDLRNQAVHAENDAINKEDAIQYIDLANSIKKQIEAITDLPKIKLTALTLLILKINHLLDSGKYDDISINEIYHHIENQTIFPFLSERTKGHSDFSLYDENGPYSNFVNHYHEKMEALFHGYAGDHRRKWGVENKGLCLLLAWTNELIQQGSGWHPNEM